MVAAECGGDDSSVHVGGLHKFPVWKGEEAPHTIFGKLWKEHKEKCGRCPLFGLGKNGEALP